LRGIGLGSRTEVIDTDESARRIGVSYVQRLGRVRAGAHSNLRRLPRSVRNRLVKAARAVDLDRLPDLDAPAGSGLSP